MRYALICCAALVVGCGGNGGGSEPPPSSLAGEWSGTWGPGSPNLPPPPGDTGSFALVISESGQVTGTCVNDGYGETGVVTGTVTAEGELDMTVDYPTKTDAIVYGSPGTDLSGRIIFGSEEFTKTVHLYQVDVALNRE